MVRATVTVAPQVRAEAAGLTDRGRVRSENQDSFLIAELRRELRLQAGSLEPERQQTLSERRSGQALLVADGIASTPAGRRASALSVETFVRLLLEELTWERREAEGTARDPESDWTQSLTEAVQACQDALVRDAARRPERQGMGTTLTAAFVAFPRLSIAHVGDSRCYLLRDGRLRQLTHDHTVAQQLVDEGVLSPAEAAESRYRHVLWNAIGGGSPELAPDVHHLELRVHDTLFLCTDGLTKHLDERRIAAHLQEASSAEACCQALVEETNDAGGTDNTAVIVARFSPRPQAAGRRG